MKLARSVLLVALVGSGAVVASDAWACGFFDYVQVRPAKPRPKPVPVAANERIATAVQRLDEERLVDAATEVVAAFPNVRSTQVGASPLETRGQRVLALAVVRGEGALAGVHGLSATAPAQRAANVAWATGVLRDISAARRDDPVALADLAEALASTPAGEEEALGILSDLAERDLMGSAHAYATLARLRVSHGDAAAARGALSRCEQMTRNPASACKAPDGRLAVRD